jgi:hypothetical protein
MWTSCPLRFPVIEEIARLGGSQPLNAGTMSGMERSKILMFYLNQREYYGLLNRLRKFIRLY